MTPRTLGAVGDDQGGRAGPRNALDDAVEVGGHRPAAGSTTLGTESAAPLRIWRPSMSSPDMRVVAEKGTKSWSSTSRSRSRMSKRSLASTTMERPSGVSSASEASWAASATSRFGVAADAGRSRDAIRLPRVMVPVLSSSRVCTSPAASTARPLMASTLRCTSRSMPAMPMAESRAPMVVGIRHTSSDTRTTTETVAPA